ncbi:MAG: hypothetical protein ACI9JY_003121 [Saprospiraceae bacterium]|jgi:hypothetical protein
MLVEKFHILAQIFISFLGGVLLLAIWYNIRQRFRTILEEDEQQKRVDKGLLYLSLAMFVWVLSGIWTYIGLTTELESSILKQGVRSLFSILNNLFFLLALFYFYYAPAFLYKNEKNVKRILFFIVAISGLSIVLFQYFGEEPNAHRIKISFLPDLLLSAFLSGLLMVSFYKTFLKGGLKVIAGISVAVILLMFLSQLPEVFAVFENDFTNNLIRIIAKTSLISIFLVLATSWVIQLANTPVASEMNLKFMDWSMVKITIPSKNIVDQTVDFGSKTTQYKNLLKFAIRRKHAEGSQQCLEIYAGGELKSQTYLTRIIDNINQILNLQELKKLERRDLFTFIGNGKYRLRVLSENITIDDTLLEEFIKASENKGYSDLCNNL